MIAGRVIGTEDSTPLELWAAVAEGEFLQLGDVIAMESTLPSGETVSIYGLVTQVRGRHEGVRFDSDLYSLLATLCELAAGRAPFTEGDLFYQSHPYPRRLLFGASHRTFLRPSRSSSRTVSRSLRRKGSSRQGRFCRSPGGKAFFGPRRAQSTSV